jgi:hypothetical protein
MGFVWELSELIYFIQFPTFCQLLLSPYSSGFGG